MEAAEKLVSRPQSTAYALPVEGTRPQSTPKGGYWLGPTPKDLAWVMASSQSPTDPKCARWHKPTGLRLLCAKAGPGRRQLHANDSRACLLQAPRIGYVHQHFGRASRSLTICRHSGYTACWYETDWNRHYLRGRLQEQGAAAALPRAAPGRLQRQGAAATPPRTAPDRLQRHQQDAPAIARLCLLNPDPTPIYPGHQFGHVCSSFSIVLREIFFDYTFCMGNALDPRSPIQPTLAVAGRSGT